MLYEFSQLMNKRYRIPMRQSIVIPFKDVNIKIQRYLTMEACRIIYLFNRTVSMYLLDQGVARLMFNFRKRKTF
jgi:hypothetical protein